MCLLCTGTDFLNTVYTNCMLLKVKRLSFLHFNVSRLSCAYSNNGDFLLCYKGINQVDQVESHQNWFKCCPIIGDELARGLVGYRKARRNVGISLKWNFRKNWV